MTSPFPFRQPFFLTLTLTRTPTPKLKPSPNLHPNPNPNQNPDPNPNPDPNQARHPDGSKCFTDRSLEFQEKITRTSCISEDSIFPETIFATEKAGYWGKDAEKKVRSSPT